MTAQLQPITLFRMNSRAITEAAHATLAGKLPFREIVAKLVAAGVEYYHVERLPAPQRGRRQRQACRLRHDGELSAEARHSRRVARPRIEPNLIGVTRQQRELVGPRRSRLRLECTRWNGSAPSPSTATSHKWFGSLPFDGEGWGGVIRCMV